MKHFLIALLIVVGSLYEWHHFQQWNIEHGGHDYWFGGDFRVYYMAASGDTQYSEGKEWWSNWHQGWLYPDWTRAFWKPFTLLPYEVAWRLWYGILTASAILIAWKLLKYDYWWLILFALIKPIAWGLHTGNVVLLFAALSLTPAGAVLASACKPYFALFLALHAVKSEGVRRSAMVLVRKTKLRLTRYLLANRCAREEVAWQMACGSHTRHPKRSMVDKVTC